MFFRLAGGQPIPLPSRDEDGFPRRPSRTVLDVAETAARTDMRCADLEQLWLDTYGDQAGPRPATTVTVALDPLAAEIWHDLAQRLGPDGAAATVARMLILYGRARRRAGR